MSGRFVVLLGMLLLVLGLSSRPAMAAELCTEVWAPGAGDGGLNDYVSSSGLNLPSFTGTVSLTSQNPRPVSTGDSQWLGGSSPNGWRLSVSAAGAARVFVNGSLNLGNNAVLSAPSGNPEDLVLVVNGSLVTGNNVVINGFVYVTGAASIGNNFTLSGALSTAGALSVGNNADTSYVDPGDSSFGGLCEPPAPPQTCLADDFNRAALGPDWAVSRSLGSFLPSTVSQRLRLTSNDYNLATAASLQRIFPASGNLVQVEFTYNAYQGGSGGGDGIAVIFSDAAVTPQPGAYGGSLGYAQRSGIAGFAGGWLGIGLDEFGNFSANSEGRVGGPGRRQDSVAIRGSAGNAYRYLTGTGSLTPGIDAGSTSSTPGPGHRYRISIDLRTAGRAWVTVERDVNGGSNYQPLIAPFDALQDAAQAPVPDNFVLSFTGSTGSARNIHELDDLQICARQILPVGQQIDHYEFVHAGNALTCNPLSVEVRACLNADCSLRHTGPVSVTLSPSGWEGGSSRTFSGGTLVDNLRVTTAQTVTLAVSNSSPPLKALSQTLCKVGTAPLSSNCNVTFADSGFIFDVPTLLARKEQTDIALQAVRKDNATQRCVPAFGPATRTLQFSSGHVDPGSGSMRPWINDTEILASPTALPLVFDDQATAWLKVRYDDAGLMQLNARFDGTGLESGLVMTGTDQFVSKPYGLHVSTPADASCTAAGVAGCSLLRAAGDGFPLRIRAVAWQADDEELTAAALSDNEATPNFELASIGLTGTLVAPAPAEGGVAGAFYRHDASGTRSLLNSYDHVRGTSTDLTVSQGEVGIFQLTATPLPDSYHGQTVNGGTSALIGRFTPAYLGVTSSASLAPACGAFSYQGQPIGFAGGQPQIAVTGYNRQGGVTRNYDRGTFWRLAPPQRQSYSLIAAGRPDLAARLQSLGDARSLVVDEDSSVAADGSRAFDWRADSSSARLADALQWQLSSPPSDEDLPLVLTAAGEHVRLRIGAGELADADGICYRGSGGSAAACQDFEHAFGGTELRLGRLRIDANEGPQDQTLDLPYWLESWLSQDGSSVWGETLGDSCSLPLLGDVLLDPASFTGDLQASDFPAPPGTLEAAPATTPTPSGVLRLAAPNRSGSVLASLSGLNGATPALSWLLFDWNVDGTPEAASARATFGVLPVQRALIFRRELYRQ